MGRESIVSVSTNNYKSWTKDHSPAAERGHRCNEVAFYPGISWSCLSVPYSGPDSSVVTTWSALQNTNSSTQGKYGILFSFAYYVLLKCNIQAHSGNKEQDIQN